MHAQLLKNAPKARCYKCRTTDIAYICHQCGRVMCGSHTFFTSVSHKNQKENENSKPKLLTTEFTKLNLSDTECGEEPFHCSDCIHIVRRIAWKQIFIGSFIVVISLLAIPNNRIGTKLLGLLTGGGLVGYEIYANTKRKKKAIKEKPPLPVLPSIDKVQITEILKAHITLDSHGHYQTIVSSSQGQLDIDMSLKGEDYERLEKYYRRKYCLAEKFNAGFLVLKGTAGISFSEEVLDGLVVLNPNDTVIRLVDHVNEQPLLSGVDERNAHKKHICLSYYLLEKGDSTFFPIQLVLSFLLTTDQRGLEMAIQWKPPQASDNYKGQLPKLQISKIELLELKFPVSWGRVENINLRDNASILEDRQTISWRKVQIETETEADKECRCTFQVKFENRIDPLDNDSVLTGNVKVIFQKTLSGLEDIQLYFPTGKPQQSFDKKKSIIQTEVEANFELTLANVRYQHTRILPEDDKSALNRQRTLDFLGISPTYNTIALLTDAMSSTEQGFYVKQVIENQPTINAAANVLNRSWVIFGRWYEGVYPIDFQVDLSGHEEMEYQLQEASRITRVRLTVKGTYSNPEMEQQIERIWEKLATLIEETFQQLSEEEEDWKTKALSPSLEESSILTAFFEE
ncbi:MAG: hypothetical protein V7K90_24565 [Nostoc sp.]|uniref:hypothetical protein n=1 Tax=Nostoc sp. TaxID=1180 RepID=UPI002FF8CB8D